MRVAVIGTGSAGRRHVANLSALGHEVFSWDPEGSATVAGKLCDSFEQALSCSEAVVVASPSVHHADQACAALERGLHVLIEKPLATSAADAERVVETHKRRGTVAAVAMNLRFHPGVLRLKELLDGGRLGTPYLAKAHFGHDLRQWRPCTDYRSSYSARPELGGGVVLDSVHEIDYMLWLLGPVSSVTAELGRLSDLDVDVEDTAAAILRFESGALGILDLNFFERAYRRGALVAGSEATAEWSWRASSVELREAEDSHAFRVDIDVDLTYVAEIENFIASIDGHSLPRTTVEEGAAAVRVADAMFRSARSGARIEV